MIERKFPLIEATINFHVDTVLGKYRVRVWVDDGTTFGGISFHGRLIEAVRQLEQVAYSGSQLVEKIVELVTEVDGVNAVEIQEPEDEHGVVSGVVVYTSWP